MVKLIMSMSKTMSFFPIGLSNYAIFHVISCHGGDQVRAACHRRLQTEAALNRAADALDAE